MSEEIRTYIMERWGNNRMRFQNVFDNDIFPNIIRKIDKASTFTNLWLVRMSNEHMFEVRHVENPIETFTINLKDYICSCRRWELTGFPCVNALSAMKSRNFKIDDCIPEYYMKSRFVAVYKHVIYPVKGSNFWVKTPYLDVHPPKFRNMPDRPKKRRNLEKGEIDGTDRKMRRTCFIVKCSRCKKAGHTKLTCKVTPKTQVSQYETQGNAT
ncbi:unnamed protein product [Lathyrus oleraceus]